MIRHRFDRPKRILVAPKQSGQSCPAGCHGDDAHQPDPLRPERILVVCTLCGAWSIYASERPVIRLFPPESPEVTAVAGR